MIGLKIQEARFRVHTFFTKGRFSMFSFLKKDPEKKIKVKIEALYKKSVDAQRNGNLRLYGEIMTEIDKLQSQLNPHKKD